MKNRNRRAIIRADVLLTSDPKSTFVSRKRQRTARALRIELPAPRHPHTTWFYTIMRSVARFVHAQCIRTSVMNPQHMSRAGGYLLAPTHVSHVEPMILTALFDRPITWMARIEFFRVPVLAMVLRWANSFAINRQGVPVRAMRTAIARASAGEIVGIFPEGGCRKGQHLAMRGGRIKQGICTIALRAGVPIVPCVVLGTHALNDIEPWIPGQHGRVWIAFGEAILPPAFPQSRRERRRVRRELAEQLEREYVRTYHALLAHASLTDAMTP